MKVSGKEIAQVLFQKHVVGRIYNDATIEAAGRTLSLTHSKLVGVQWYHEGGQQGIEILPYPIPNSAIQSWKKGGLRLVFKGL